MSDSLREAVARAISDAFDAWKDIEYADGLDHDDECMRFIADAALAAIEASGTHCIAPLEPTDIMCVKGSEAVGGDIPDHWLPTPYKAMLAARPREFPAGDADD